MNLNNIDALEIEKSKNIKAKRELYNEAGSLLFMVSTLILGWLAVIVAMVNGGQGIL